MRSRSHQAIPSKRKRADAFELPAPSIQPPVEDDTEIVVPTGDFSARRKRARIVHNPGTLRNSSEDEELAERDELLAEEIWNEAEEDDADVPGVLNDDLETAPPSASATPSKRKPGRPKGSHRKRSATPPENLAPHEQYFFHNRPGGNKTSTNTLASLSLLSHEDYFNLIQDFMDPHDSERAFLHDIHSRAFGQWRFEMSEGFSVCLYGWGSKRKLMTEYAEWLYSKQRDETSDEERKIVVVNGYISTVSMKSIIQIVATAFFGPDHPYKLGGQPGEMLEKLFTLLDDYRVSPITLVIHSIDSPPLRRPSTQALLARLASHDSVQLLASADHPSFPLLWDSSLRESFNFVFHDCTTFDPYEVEFDVVDSVNELLGRSGRQVSGREGVGYVLKSLPENARNLYRVLVSEQLAGIEDGLTRERNDGTGGASTGDEGVEYRVLYQKAVEEFICSSEVAFRTLLKEFHDHQMIASKKDVLGTEILWVPFRKEELEAILEDLVG